MRKYGETWTLFPPHYTYFVGLFILCKHLVSLFLSLFFLQLLFGQWVTVVVSWQQSEVTFFLWVVVKSRQL